MKCAIMQPTYLPWAGYFSMINSSDVFIFLDDVQFAKRSWQQRNKIILNRKERLLTVPVEKSGKSLQKIEEVRFTSNGWFQSHQETINQAYGRHPYFDDVKNILNSTFNQSTDYLQDINIQFIKSTMDYLNITTPLLNSSHIPVKGNKSEYLYNICQYIGADSYISAPGSIEYIEKERIFETSKINVETFTFNTNNYKQLGVEEFISHLSIIDVIANLGKQGTIEYINQ
ncbi:WbqC family protein [Viridibacillus arvi]|uniref:WbqC family protein n=1 Tax=Viridibacillus arvi TaxID=263475 RepID=UPI003D092123